jgi:hypothetical protein
MASPVPEIMDAPRMQEAPKCSQCLYQFMKETVLVYYTVSDLDKIIDT